MRPHVMATEHGFRMVDPVYSRDFSWGGIVDRAPEEAKVALDAYAPGRV